MRENKHIINDYIYFIECNAPELNLAWKRCINDKWFAPGEEYVKLDTGRVYKIAKLEFNQALSENDCTAFNIFLSTGSQALPDETVTTVTYIKNIKQASPEQKAAYLSFWKQYQSVNQIDIENESF